MDKKTKIILISAMIIIILVIIVMVVLIYMNENRDKEQDFVYIEEFEEKIDKKIRKVENRNNFYIAKSCVEKFYAYYTANASDNYILDEESSKYIKEQEKEKAKSLYYMLDTDYIKENSITQENVIEKLEKKDTLVINITNMYEVQQTETTSLYFVYGTLRDKKTGKITELKVAVKVDFSNQSFKILLQDFINKHYKDIQEGEEINIESFDKIEQNQYNKYDYVTISDTQYVTDLFNKYKEEILYNATLAYNNLEPEYQKQRFKNVEEFKEYAVNNTKKNVIMKVEKYQKLEKDGYTQYVCIDQNDNYYIFNETAVMNYKMILDTYTMDLPEYIETYNKSDVEKKVAFNIQRIFQAINTGDYRYAYNKLDESFRNKYFKNQEQFQKYIENKWFKNNKVNYIRYEKKGDVNNYTIEITDLDGVKSSIVTQDIVMQLQEGTNYKISFNVIE